MIPNKPKQAGDLRVLFWNIRDWGTQTNSRHLTRILATLRRESPDIALFAEISTPAVKTALARHIPGPYTIFETADKNPRHLMAIFNHAAAHPITIEQRNEFSNLTLTERTFPLLRLAGRAFNCAVLAAHTHSGATPADLTQRQKIISKITALHKNLKAEKTPLLVLGDMNIMGNGSTLSATREREITASILGKHGMALLPKDSPVTWHGIDRDKIYPDADLDHAFLSLPALKQIRPVNDKGALVRVSGWPDWQSPPMRDRWVRRYSDHAYLVIDIKPTMS